MRFGSVCSGIESASMAWEPLGWEAAWFSEVEPFPPAVLAHRWPRVVNYGDMCSLPEFIAAGAIEAPDVLVGGTPCQAFSVAGMRKGLDDDRGQLTIKYVEVANAIDEKRPDGEECSAVWENVPGVLSSKDNAFGCFLAALTGENEPLQPAGEKWTNAGVVCGPQRVAAWRVLDARYFGVAQRRRRVFVVASARNGFCPTSVLFESEARANDLERGAYKERGLPVLTCRNAGNANARGVALFDGKNFRALTPKEEERRQGFPYDHTRIPWRGKCPADCPDGPRYKAIGNSKAVPVVKWLGERIAGAL